MAGRIAPGTKVPWERHSTTEEGFLLEGDYRLSECLRTGSMTGDYSPGGYFHRPGGILHSGPESGTRTGAVWLMRSPGTLDLQFYTECREGRGEGPIGTPAAPAPSSTGAAPAPQGALHRLRAPRPGRHRPHDGTPIRELFFAAVV